MAEKKFVVFSMKEKKAKEIAKVIASEKAKAILDLLATKRASPSEISKKLDLPLSTVQYNLGLLIEAGLIKQTGYKYSKKGKEIKYYEPTRKAIILAPESAKKSIIEFLGDKVILPLIFVVSVVSGYAVQLIAPKPAVEKLVAAEMAAGAPTLEAVVTETVAPAFNWNYFVIGAVVTLLILLTIYFSYKKVKTSK